MTGNSRKGYINRTPKCYVELPDKSNPASNVVKALQHTKDIGSISIIGPREYFHKLRIEASDFLLTIPQRDNATFADNLFDSFYYTTKTFGIKDDTRLLYASGDTPFRTFRSIRELLFEIRPEYDLLFPLIPKRELIPLFRELYKKPLVPIAFNNGENHREISWYKADEIIFLDPSKLPRDNVDLLYQRRRTNRLTWFFEVKKIFSNKYPELWDIVKTGWALKQWHRVTRNMPEFINTPKIFNGILDSRSIEQIVSKEPLNIKAHMFESHFAEGYIDIDNEADYRKICANYYRITRLTNTLQPCL